MPKTMFQKVWEAHEVRPPEREGGSSLLYVDLHLVHEVTSAQAFEGLRLSGRRVRRPDRTLATADHNVPTDPSERTSLEAIRDVLSRKQVQALESNCAEFGIPYHGMGSRRQGIVHVIGPELGISQPGITIACGDSHTSTHGALGALAMPVGTSRGRARARHAVPQQVKPRTMRITFTGEPGFGVTAKDLILGTIGQISAAGATGHVVEYAGAPIEALSVEGRMTICNMSIEAGARAGMIAPDDVTFSYLEGRPGAPADFDAAVERWRTLRTDDGARVRHRGDGRRGCADAAGHLGHQPGHGRAGHRPRSGPGLDGGPRGPRGCRARARSTWRWTRARRSRTSRSTGCSSARAPTRASRTCAPPPRWSRGRTVAADRASDGRARLPAGEGAGRAGGTGPALQAGRLRMARGRLLDVPGNEPGHPQPGERCASTSNRNFEGRQGRGGRTHLVSPQMAAAAAVEGHFVDIREWT